MARKCRIHMYKGRRVTVAEMVMLNGTISKTTAWEWLKSGMTDEEVVETRIKKRVEVDSKSRKPKLCMHPDCDLCPYDDCEW